MKTLVAVGDWVRLAGLGPAKVVALSPAEVHCAMGSGVQIHVPWDQVEPMDWETAFRQLVVELTQVNWKIEAPPARNTLLRAQMAVIGFLSSIPGWLKKPFHH